MWLIFWCHIFLPFHIVHGTLQARILEWFAMPSFSGSCFVITLHYDLSVLDGPGQHVSRLHSYTNPSLPSVIHEGESSFRFTEKFRGRCWDFLYIPCIHTISSNILRFTAKLSTRYRFPYSPWPCIVSLIINISHWISTLVATDKPYWQIIITKRSQFTLGFILGIQTVGLDKYIMTFIHYYSIIKVVSLLQKSFVPHVFILFPTLKSYYTQKYHLKEIHY